jgi:hypothetical protein
MNELKDKNNEDLRKSFLETKEEMRKSRIPGGTINLTKLI